MPLAFQALKACIRLKSGEWKVWDNYLTAAMGVGDLQAAVHACCKILELQKARLDPQLIKALCDGVLERNEDEFLRRRTCDLLRDVCEQLPDNADLFGVAAEFFASIGDRDTAVDFCHRRCLALESAGDWSRDATAFARFVQSLGELVDLTAAGRKARLILGRVLAGAEKCPDLSLDGLHDLLAKCGAPPSSAGEVPATDIYATDYV